jgi:glycosyltransferase involved in cell wall biosynthesis
MVSYDMQEFGGLEEIITTLAVGLQQQGHPTSILSAAWIPPDNQYLRRLQEHGVSVAQVPQWISLPASDWPTKEKILVAVMVLFSPLVYLLAGALCLRRRQPWRQSLTSAHNWLRGQLMSRFIGPDRRKLLARLLLNWWRFRWRPDLFHIHGFHSDTNSLLFVIDWAHANSLPVVYEEHQTPDTQFDGWKDFQQTINRATTVVAVSEKSGEALRTVCGVTNLIVVANPIVTDPTASGWHRNGRPHQRDESILITTVARLFAAKGLTYLLEAIVQVKATYPAAQFRVYGEGELRQELLAYAAQLGLDGEQIFAGPFTQREELSRIMAQTDIFVMSSILEGQPLVLVEAMAYGCPIIATTVGGIPELIKDGFNGLLCQPGDSASLAQKICHLIEDPGLRLRLGQAARHSYEQGPFQPAAVCAHFISIYKDALQPDQAKLAAPAR